MNYGQMRKNYRLYIRSAGLLAMLLIICIGLVVRDTLLQTVGVSLVLGRLVFIYPLAQEKLHQQVQHLAPCRLRFSFLAAIPQLNKNVKKAISQIDIKLTSVAYSL